jgi:TPR repeat protein
MAAQGRGGLPKDDREAARLYKLAADHGNAFCAGGSEAVRP